jgi:spermidine/putrescine transport system permease protein
MSAATASAEARTPSPSRRRRLGEGVLAAPAATWLVVFFIAPVLLVLWYSFGYKPGLFGTHANDVLSFDRYVEAADGTFAATYWNTLRIAAVGTLTALVIAFPLAYWMAVKVPPAWRGLLVGLVLVPYWTNFLVRTLGWQIILSPTGFLSQGLQGAGLLDAPLAVLYTRAAVQLGVVYNYLPLMILPLYVALDRLDPALLEASRDLGATAWRALWSITVPLAAPGIGAGCLLVFVPLMGDYITPAVLGGVKGSMVGQMVASQFQSAQNWALGSAMAVLLILTILATVGAAVASAAAVRAALRARRAVAIADGGAA